MPWKTTLRLLVLVALAVGVLMFIRWREQRPQQGIRLEVRLPGPFAENVQILTVETEGYRMRCTRQNGQWVLTSPWRALADSGRIEHVLSVLEILTPHEVITAAHRERRGLTLADYGLEKPRIRLAVYDGLAEHVLAIGYEAPLSALVYARLEAFDEVVAIDSRLLEIVPDDIRYFRDRSLMARDMRRANRLEIQRPRGGFVRLDRQRDHWVLQQPIVGRADTGAVTAILQALQEARVEQFVWDRPADEQVLPETMDSQLLTYRLTPDEAALRITVWSEGEDVPSELVIGRATDVGPGLVYAHRRHSESIVAVSQALLAALAVDNVNALRERRLFPVKATDITYVAFQNNDVHVVLERDPKTGWHIVRPVQWKADELLVGQIVRFAADLRIEQFADGSAIDLGELGLAPPRFQMQVLRGRPEGPAYRQLLVGQTRADAAHVYARFEAEPLQFGEGATVFEIGGEATRALAALLQPPLALRDRTMLAHAPSEIRSLTRTSGESLQRVEQRDNGAWHDVEGSGDPVVSAIEAILFAVAGLRANKVETHNPPDLTPYGLNEPRIVLTLGLTGDAGIRKSVLLGRGAGADGVYAMIQGQDIVFTLENSVAKILGADLVAQPFASSKAEQ